ncbi:Asp-tRNA(Asn)/Glu-tRNA(Gln) amidotransferase subunit GatC [Parachlamydia sp. AcF125]|uniref:Asp-tRNA(Asn)/Glu-tRNA(Gln) amidotransferase subunit GatC n=1 Tax=Parachlamydia sp. AcF125 TaxID=2795736 RepID=UPI001BC9FAF8|nr:Asp-tRNA(Asn)/Glu-tRNA(Gln) amidotransferase subunit GatC [Parachlamydia sp. AcF125]MBS4168514.1 Glutamyl-tRNA(Gln) amidotransferase subunit C [Parachlamydia sp. AcF125]
MTLNKETLKNLAQLSRIRYSEEEEEALLKDLQSILAYIDELKEIDTTDVKACNHVLEEISNVMRPDVVGATLPRKTFLDNSPSQVSGMIRVPLVIKSKS